VGIMPSLGAPETRREWKQIVAVNHFSITKSSVYFHLVVAPKKVSNVERDCSFSFFVGRVTIAIEVDLFECCILNLRRVRRDLGHRKGRITPSRTDNDFRK
jgi:hypothetical protein